MDTRGFVVVLAREAFEGFLRADIGHTTTGHDAFFHSSTCSAESIVAAVFFLLLFGFAGSTHFEHAHATGEFAKAFLEFFLVVVARRVSDFALDEFDALSDVLFRTGTIDDGRVVLRYRNLFGRTEHFEGGLFEFQALFLTDDHTTRENGNVFEHRFAAVAETRSFDSANLELCAETVHHKSSQRFAIHIFGNDEEGTTALHGRFEDGQKLLHARNLLVVDEDIGVLHIANHLLGVGHEVGRKITAVELHTFYGLEHRVASFGIFNRDHTVHRNGTHTVGNEFTDFAVVVGRDGGHLFNLVVVAVHLFGLCFDAFHHALHGLVDTALEVERIGTSGHVFHTFRQNGLCQYGGRGGAVAGIVTGLGSHTLHELCTCILEGVIEFDFTCHAHTIFGDAGSAEFLVDDNIATLRAEGNFYCIGQSVSTLAELFAGINVIFNFFCHDSLLFFIV